MSATTTSAERLQSPLFDAQGTFKSLLSAIDGFSLSGMAIYPYGYADFKCQLPAGVAVADGDMIRMATSADNGTTWLPVAGELVTTNEIPAKGAAPQYFAITRPSSITGATFTGENSVIRGWNYHFTVVPEFPERDMVTVKPTDMWFRPVPTTHTPSAMWFPTRRLQSTSRMQPM